MRSRKISLIDAKTEIESSIESGAFGNAPALCEAILSQHSDQQWVLPLYGYALLLLNRNEEALKVLREAAHFFSDDLNVLNRLGIAMQRNALFDESILLFERLVGQFADNQHLNANLLTSLCLSKRYRTAIDFGWQISKRWPENNAINVNLANALLAAWKNQEAYGVLRPLYLSHSLGLEGLISFTTAAIRLNHTQEARSAVDAILQLAPDSYEGLSLLAHLQKNKGDTASAYQTYRRALQLNDSDPQIFSNMLFCMMHDESIGNSQLLLAHQEFSTKFESTEKANQSDEIERQPNRKLRIGILSGDLVRHPVTAFVLPVLLHIDEQKFDLYAFSNHPMQAEVSATLSRKCKAWNDIWDLADTEVNALIRAQKIDILIDLSGHTARNRLQVIAQKPAPIQMCWIGYPCTTGLKAVDYSLTDRYSSPVGSYDQYWTEKFLRIPVAIAFEIKKNLPEVGKLPALQNGYLSFGSFNRPEKIGARVVALWARVMLAVPRSRMVLANMSDREARRRLIALFGEDGIHEDRLEFHDSYPEPEYLALHQKVDFILDAFPWAGSTITSIALQMGVPTLSLRGNNRMWCNGNAILERHGLPEWVAENEDAFVNRALHFATQLESLAQLRASLRQQIHAQLASNAEQIARYMEIAFREIWHRWCDGLPVEALDLTDMCLRETSST
jgi:predicted O-linked N-acetylglucosamine transferase (SPINDLY family)